MVVFVTNLTQNLPVGVVILKAYFMYLKVHLNVNNLSVFYA